MWSQSQWPPPRETSAAQRRSGRHRSQCGKGTAVLFLCPPGSGPERNMQTWGPFLKGKTSASLEVVHAELGS
ncbi:hypothetical protein D4Z77_08735 [Campylobacter coli]|nr:hypothetical protein D4Z77_08735 [Campylobacter coli]